MKYLPISILLGLAWSITNLSADASTLLASNTNSKKVEQSDGLIKLAQTSSQNPQVWKLQRLNRTWDIKIQKQEDGNTGNFIGWYSNINNDSIFTGKLLTGRGNTLVNFVQQGGNGYYSVFSGTKINSNLYEGKWYDTSGRTGTFQLVK